MLGLYLHIPFCRRKCPYCDFFSITATAAPIKSYPALLEQHLVWAAGQGWQGPVDTVYFGGGTPSLLAAEAIGNLLTSVDRHLGLTAGAEITLEANPDSVTASGLRGLRTAGVNRLSLGLQSLDDRQLQQLGRLHDRRANLAAVTLARAAGFTNLSLDLMFALPGQDENHLARELEQFLELDPQHLSCYGLTAEPGTPFAAQVEHGRLRLPDPDRYADAFLQVRDRLTSSGYAHYEIASYARESCRCRHNLRYWQRRPYLGLGAGAHSFDGKDWGSRWAVAANLAGFRAALQAQREPAECLEHFNRDGALRETIYLALRTTEGLSDSLLQRRFGTSLAEAFPEAVRQLAPWLMKRQDSWSFSPSGWLLYDRLIQAFL